MHCASSQGGQKRSIRFPKGVGWRLVAVEKSSRRKSNNAQIGGDGRHHRNYNEDAI